MSEENKDIQEQEQDQTSQEEKQEASDVSGAGDKDTDSSQKDRDQGPVQEKKEEKEETAKDLMKDDDDLPEDIKKKLEKKKTEKSSKKSASKKVKKKKKERGKVDVGKAYIKATYNNTIVTITDLNGEVISWASAGVAGFKGPKKSTPYAAQIITKIATMKAKQEYGMKELSVFVKGVGMGRESAIRTLNSQGLFVTSIKDITPIPHNGCRPRKPRRV